MQKNGNSLPIKWVYHEFTVMTITFLMQFIQNAIQTDEDGLYIGTA